MKRVAYNLGYEGDLTILCPTESVDGIVPMFMKILKIQDDFDPDGQLDSIATTELSTLSMGHGLAILVTSVP